MPNITTFHVFIGQHGVRIASVWVENEPGLVLGNIFILVPVMVPIHSIPLHQCISIAGQTTGAQYRCRAGSVWDSRKKVSSFLFLLLSASL